MRNPYRRSERRAAWRHAVALAEQGLDYPEIAKALDPAIQREVRWKMAASVVRKVRGLKVQQDKNSL